ncbi:MAG TPA: hypothetical protein VKZ18_14740 [Polyangia bacterium]|nr:hypothetical protein [Polyangia bacterium]
MRRLVWLSGVLLALSCEVNTNNLNLDASGSGGATGVGGCPRCVGTGGNSASGGTTGAGGVSSTGGTTGTGGDGQSGGTTGTGGDGQSGGATGAGGNSGKGGNNATGGKGGSGGNGNKGGNNGSGGSATGGNNGSGGQGGAAGCDSLATQYTSALQTAKKCTTGAANQCQDLVDSVIGCNNCKTYVNDDTTLNAITDQWTAAGCAVGHFCSAVACVAPTTTCAAVSPTGPAGGAGMCQNSLIGGTP